MSKAETCGKLANKGANLGPKERALLMGFRQTLIMALGLVEDYLGLERSIVPRRKRNTKEEGIREEKPSD